MSVFFRRLVTTKGVKRVTRLIAAPFFIKRINRDLSRINAENNGYVYSGNNLLYIRSDFWFKDNTPNGALAHTEGIVNAFSKNGFSVDLLTAFPVSLSINCRSVSSCIPNGWATGISELEEVEYNSQLFNYLNGLKQVPSLVYQRYSRYNYAGLLFAKTHQIPYVLEYNGSEVWMGRNWGKPLRYEQSAIEIENTVLRHADIVLGNAEAFRSELLAKGVKSDRILIIPNGVDTDIFKPEIDKYLVKEKLGIKEDEIVVSFVGSFGPWHGAEVLAKSVSKVSSQNQNVRFLFIGDGERMSSVKAIVRESHVEGFVLFTGFIDRETIGYYLSASDILVSPQVPNPDGTPFFGSPTKLFEYMAMGKAIVASDLDQIGFILSSGDDSLLFKPGDSDELASAILTLASDPSMRARLGNNARKKAITCFSWDKHVQAVDRVLRN